MDKKVGPNKGKRFSKEWKRKLSESHKGKTISKNTRKKMSNKHKEDFKTGKRIPTWLGKKQSKESNLKRSKKLKGRIISEKSKKRMSKSSKLSYKNGKIKLFGDKNPAKRPEVRKKLSEQKKGKNNPRYGKHPWNYIDGRSLNKAPMRYGNDWDDIRHLVYERDKWICQKCKRHKPLDVHHKIPFRISFDNSLNNLISLCRSCHIKEEIKFWKQQKDE